MRRGWPRRRSGPCRTVGRPVRRSRRRAGGCEDRREAQSCNATTASLVTPSRAAVTMGGMSEAPEQQQSLEERGSSERQSLQEQGSSERQSLQEQPRRRLWWHSLQATPTRRALLLTALGGLLIAGITPALPAGADDPGRLVGYSNAAPSAGNRASQAFDNAR